MKPDLVVPVYIDTNALLDLLASIEGGFSTVEKVMTRRITGTESEKSTIGDVAAEFGIPNVLNLLKIRLSGSLGSKKQHVAGEEKETERYYTYGSLLHRLRAFLDDYELIKRPWKNSEDWETIVPSDFVEVHGIFRPNPMAELLENIVHLIGLFEVFGDFILQISDSFPAKKGAQDPKKQIKQIREFLQGVLKGIEAKNTRVFVIDVTCPYPFQVVVPLMTAYLRDRTMTELACKEYRLLGKVVRKIEQGSNDTIDLLRGTPLGGVGRQFLEQLWDALIKIEPINLPQAKPEVSGPALEIIPIAIYI